MSGTRGAATLCNICGHDDLRPLAPRSDGVMVLRCTRCGMGVVEWLPDNLMALYAEGYYGGAETGPGTGASGQGYEDYAFTAEHGVAWAAALVRLLRPGGGRVLDIGCADGHLLAKLGPQYEAYGIEVNEAMGRRAARRGATVVGRDLLDPALVAAHAGRFDVVTAIAVFENLRDFREGVRTALRLLKEDGVLVFEVPLISESADNTTWFTTSLERVWYPSEAALRRCLDAELGARLVGAEVHVQGYASTYVGLAFLQAEDAARMQALFTRIAAEEGVPEGPEERTARVLLRLVHAACASFDDVGALADLPAEQINPPLLRRLGQLWQAGVRKLRTAREEQRGLAEALERETGRVRRLEGELAAATADRKLNLSQLSSGLAAAELRLRGASITGEGLRKQVASLERESEALRQRVGDLEAELARIIAVQGSVALRAAIIARGLALRHPALARVVRGILRAVVRTLRQGRALLRRVRAGGPAATASGEGPAASAPAEAAVPQPSEPVVLPVSGRMPQAVAIETGPWRADQPLVSVVIPCFNYGHFVEEAVDSAIAQTFRDLEVIVVEGGSASLGHRLLVAQLDRPGVRVLLQGEPHRVGANRNFGIGQARGRYICCLDADDRLHPTYIEKALFLLEHGGYDVVSSAQRTFGNRAEVLYVAERPDLAALLQNNQVLTTAVFRRALWERSGGYRDSDPSADGHVYEDWAFWVRLGAFGARFYNMARDPLLLHRSHGPSLSTGADVLPLDRQRAQIREMNADVLDAEAVARSKRLAADQEPRAAPVTLDLARDVAWDDGRRPVVILAMPYLILGGAERLLSAVVGHLAARGWRVLVVTTLESQPGDGDATPWFETHTQEIFHLPLFLPRLLWDAFLRHLVATRRADILWIVGSAFAYDRLRALRTEFPCLKVADLLFNTVGHTANNRRRRDLIDLNLVENEEVRSWLLDSGEAEERVRLVVSGVDLGELRPAPRSPEVMRRTGAGPGDLLIGFAGRWSEEKDPLAFVEIARQVDPSLAVRFVMTGAGPLRSAVEHAVGQAGFPAGRFHLFGEVPDIAEFVAAFDLLVMPSRIDGRPFAVLEALAMGVPVLASRVGALPELIAEGETGWLFVPGDVAAFAARIDAVARAPATLASMRRAARAYAEEHLDERRMLAAYEDALGSLVDCRMPRPAGQTVPRAKDRRPWAWRASRLEQLERHGYRTAQT